MPEHFRFDVAYQSNIDVVNINDPISMAYGFVKLHETGSNEGLGEKVSHSMRLDDTMSFRFLDTAQYKDEADRPTITSAEISWQRSGFRTGPFEGTSLNGMLRIPPTQLENGQSIGCNMKGHFFQSEKFTIRKYKTKRVKRTYKFTVTVVLSNGKKFVVDPEVDVMAE